MSSKTDFLISKASLAFMQLKKVFTKALILYHLDLKYYIQIETDVLGYAIARVLSKLTSQMIHKPNFNIQLSKLGSNT